MNEFDQEFDLPEREPAQSDSGADTRAAEESSSPFTARDVSREAGDFKSEPRETGQRPVSTTHAGDHAPALEMERVCRAFIDMTEGPNAHHSLRTAASSLGKSPSWFSGPDSMLARYRRDGIAGLMPRRGTTGAKPGDLSAWMEALPWFIPAANQFWLLSNRNKNSGSVPEAIRRTISLPHVPVGWKNGDKLKLLRAMGLTEMPTCPPELRAALIQREREGKDFVTERVRKQIMRSPATVHQYRNAKNAALDYLNAPGGMRLIGMHGTDVRLARAGELLEMDDATINFPVCVPWTRGADECSQKFGVMVGRFQFLVSIDAGTSFIPAWNYTARPRGSYRGEDVLSLMKMIAGQHGIPRRWRLERGVWKSNLVTGAIKNMGAELDTVYSPHQKPFIEGLFNTLWTKLSVQFPGIDVGRFMGETDEVTQILMACRKGAKDPRRHFPMLATVVEAFREVIAEKNRTPVDAGMHGRWVPEERWEAELNRPKLPAESAWLFSPIVKTNRVKGMLVGCRVPMFEGVSVPFDFSAPWLPQFDGALVTYYFDPAAPKCHATVVLAENWRNHKKGEVLGQASQIGEHASYVRLVMGWGDDPANAGRKARQQAAAAMRREVRAVIPRGKAGAADSEERDGLGLTTKVESGQSGSSALPQGGTPNAEGGKTGQRPVSTERTAEEIEERERARERTFANPLDFV